MTENKRYLLDDHKPGTADESSDDERSALIDALRDEGRLIIGHVGAACQPAESERRNP